MNPRQAHELQTAATYVGERGGAFARGPRLMVPYACMYFAGWHIETFGVADDGHVFSSSRGREVDTSTWDGTTWTKQHPLTR